MCHVYNDSTKNRFLEKWKYTQGQKTAEICQKTLKFASHCYYLSLSLYNIVIIISRGLFRLINDLSGPLKTVFHTAKVGMDTTSHNNVT